jgi:hypothetical protein
MFVKMAPKEKKCAKLSCPAGAKKTPAGANFPRFSLLLGGGRRKSDAGEAYVKFYI